MTEQSENLIDKPLKNAPVYFSVIQAKFNPVPAMDQLYVGKIQDLLRKEGFVNFKPETGQVLEVKPGEKSSVKEVKSWHMSNEAQTAGYVLNSDSITFRTTDYKSRVEFLASFFQGLKVVHEVVELSHINRLGLRYLSAVIPNQEETIKEYLSSPLSDLNVGERVSRLSEVRLLTELPETSTKGQLIARVFGSNSQLGYPADMVPNGLVPKSEFSNQFSNQSVYNHAVIDIDHFSDERFEFKLEEIQTRIKDLHLILKRAFVESVSKHALEVWK